MMWSLLRPALIAGLVGVSGLASAQSPAAPPAATPAPAQTTQPLAPPPSASHMAAARDLIAAQNVLAPIDELLPSFGEQIRKQNITRPELSKDLDAVINGLAPELVLQRQRVSEIVARVYTKWLTEAELKELAAFYRTPLGQKFNRIQPDMVDEVVNDVGIWTQEASEYVITRVRAEMAKRGHQLQ